MGRKKIYPQAPGPDNNEMPYDYWAFKRWCVNSQQLSESTADVYISGVRVAFTTLFDERDATFKNLRNAFLSHTRDLKRRILRLEDNYERLMAYSECVEEFGDNEDWTRAFQCYCRFIRWRIDGERMNMGMKIEVEDDHTKFLELPLRRQFRMYMQNKGKGYEVQTINTYCSLLKRLYNLLIRRAQKIDILGYVVDQIERRKDIKFFLDVLQKRIGDETKLESIPDLSDDDVLRGEVAFRVYREFLEDYSCNPQKYPPKECYEIPRRNNKKKDN